MDVHAHRQVQGLMAAARVPTRQIPETDIRRFEGYVSEIFTALGLDLNKPATRDTPRRFIQAMLKPHGVAVYLEARHLCTQMRGVSEPAAVTRTAFWRGNYDGNDALRSEFLRMCGVQGRNLASDP